MREKKTKKQTKKAQKSPNLLEIREMIRTALIQIGRRLNPPSCRPSPQR